MNQKINLRTAVVVLVLVGILSLGGAYAVKQKFYDPALNSFNAPIIDNHQKQGIENNPNIIPAEESECNTLISEAVSYTHLTLPTIYSV